MQIRTRGPHLDSTTSRSLQRVAQIDHRRVSVAEVSLADAWEEHAAEWISWARAPGHDGFWEGTWPELLAVLTKPDGLAIEIGCGEGRAGRQLMANGYDVVAVERSAALARAAASGDPPVAVARGDAASLPFRTGSAALVVASMVLQDVDDLAGTVREISRVLRPGGHLCFAIVHPFGSAQDDEPRRSGGTATVTAPYLAERRYVDRIERDGFAMTFVSVHRPLSTYVKALSDNGLAIDALREFGQRALPWLLVCRAVKGVSACQSN